MPSLRIRNSPGIWRWLSACERSAENIVAHRGKSPSPGLFEIRQLPPLSLAPEAPNKSKQIPVRLILILPIMRSQRLSALITGNHSDQRQLSHKLKVGFIGLGIMGSRMAANLPKHDYCDTGA